MQHLKFYRPEDDTVHEGPDRVLPCKLQCKHCGTWIADEVCPADIRWNPGTLRRLWAWRGVGWCGVVWRGVAWRAGVVWYDVAWYGMAWRGVARHIIYN